MSNPVSVVISHGPAICAPLLATPALDAAFCTAGRIGIGRIQGVSPTTHDAQSTSEVATSPCRNARTVATPAANARGNGPSAEPNDPSPVHGLAKVRPRRPGH